MQKVRVKYDECQNKFSLETEESWMNMEVFFEKDKDMELARTLKAQISWTNPKILSMS
jgi:hypothetical protein